jgi:hypothetical protein
MFSTRKKPSGSTPLSEFIRNATSEEKKKVYSEVLRRASERQNEVVTRVRIKRAEPA